jgi:flagellar hook-basal body complex protein FliE
MGGIGQIGATDTLVAGTGSKHGEQQGGFADTLVQGIRRVDQEIKAADRAAEAFASGASGSVHEVMLSMEKAELSFRLVSAVRNKLLEAYREIVRMQV